MKKVLFCMLAIAFLFGIDNKDVDDFGFDVLKKELEFMDKDLAGAWYLYNTNNSKYQKVENDEFEWHDAIEEAYNNLSKRVEQSKKTIGQVYSLNLNSSFGEYNFKEEFFPLDLITPNSYVNLYGSGFPVCNYAVSQITFDNADVAKNIMPMKKDTAKKFLASKKNKYGDIDRSLNANIEFEIKNIEVNQNIKHKDGCLGLKVTATIKNIKLSDKSTATVYEIESY